MLDGTYLVGIYFYSSVCNHVPQKFPSPYSEGTLVNVEEQLMLPKYLKSLLKILHLPLVLPTFNYHVIHIHLHYAPNLISKHPRHHPLISGLCILKSEGYRCVVIIALWGYKGRLLLILGG